VQQVSKGIGSLDYELLNIKEKKMKKEIFSFLMFLAVIFSGCASGTDPVSQSTVTSVGQERTGEILSGEDSVEIRVKLFDPSAQEKPRASNVLSLSARTVTFRFFLDSGGAGKTLMSGGSALPDGSFRTVTVDVVDGAAMASISLPTGKYYLRVSGGDLKDQEILQGYQNIEVLPGVQNKYNIKLNPAYGLAYTTSNSLLGFPGNFTKDLYTVKFNPVSYYKDNDSSFECKVTASSVVGRSDFFCLTFQFQISENPLSYIAELVDDDGVLQSAPFLVGVEQFVGVENPTLTYPEEQSVSLNVGLVFDIDYIGGFWSTNQDGSVSFTVKYEWDAEKDLPIEMKVGDSLILTLKLYDDTNVTSSCVILDKDVYSGSYTCKADFGSKEPYGPWWREGSYDYIVVPPVPQPTPTLWVG
jgi:hypothetical protein